VPHGHWKTTTLVVRFRHIGIALMVLDGPINRYAVYAYVAQVLVPELMPAGIVVMNNLSSHKASAVREMIEARGASLLYLPPYSPDFNPIEQAFSKLKATCAAPRAHHPSPLEPHPTHRDLYSPAKCVDFLAKTAATMQTGRKPI
jgi:hypothetical protein